MLEEVLQGYAWFKKKKPRQVVENAFYLYGKGYI